VPWLFRSGVELFQVTKLLALLLALGARDFRNSLLLTQKELEAGVGIVLRLPRLHP